MGVVNCARGDGPSTPADAEPMSASVSPAMIKTFGTPLALAIADAKAYDVPELCRRLNLADGEKQLPKDPSQVSLTHRKFRNRILQPLRQPGPDKKRLRFSYYTLPFALFSTESLALDKPARAGPLRTEPSGANCDPWHGQSQHCSVEFQWTWHPRWVQTAERR